MKHAYFTLSVSLFSLFVSNSLHASNLDQEDSIKNTQFRHPDTQLTFLEALQRRNVQLNGPKPHKNHSSSDSSDFSLGETPPTKFKNVQRESNIAKENEPIAD